MSGSLYYPVLTPSKFHIGSSVKSYLFLTNVVKNVVGGVMI